MKEQKLKIGQVAEQSGVLPSTIRWWTTNGLLTVVDRTKGGLFLYPESAVDRAKEIRRLQQEQRLKIEEIRTVLNG